METLYYIYVANVGSNNVSVINASTQSVTETIPVGTAPQMIALDSASGYLYVANTGSNNVTVINGHTNKVIGNINVGEYPAGDLYINSTGDIYVANENSNNISVISGETNSVISTISVLGSPDDLAYDYRNGNIYVVQNSLNQVAVINLSSRATISTTISVGRNPQMIVFDSASNVFIVPNVDSSNVSVLSGSSNRVIDTIEVGFSPYETAYDPLNGIVYVANGGSDNVSVISSELFTGAKYNVTFTDSGLQLGTIWYVNLSNGIDSGAITSFSYSFSLTNGTYSYTIATADKTESPFPSSSSFTVKGSPVSENVFFIKFTKVTYTVTFTETGLPSGTTWYVNITFGRGGVFLFITGSSYSFSLTNGTYSYTIATADKTESPTPSSGNFSVKGAPVSETITFLKVTTYTVTFSESGLPLGTTWSVALNGATHSSVSGTISFSELNGSYSYSVSSVPGYTVSTPTEIVTVDGHNISVSITFEVGSAPVWAFPGAYANYSITKNLKRYLAMALAFVMICASFAVLSEHANNSAGAQYTTQVNDGGYNFTLEGESQVGSGPNAIVTYGSYSYVASFSGNSISIFSGKTLSYTLNGGSPSTIDGPNGLAIAVVGSVPYLLISNYNGDTVSIYSLSAPSNPSFITVATVGNGPAGIAYDSGSGMIYVSDSESNTLSYFPLILQYPYNNQDVATITTGNNPEWTVYNPYDELTYSVSESAGQSTVYAISANNAIVSTIKEDYYLNLLYDSTLGATLAVSEKQILGIVSGKISQTFQTNGGYAPWASTEGPGDLILSVNQTDSELIVYNTSNPSAVVTIPLTPGDTPQGIGYNAEKGTIYAADFKVNEVSFLSASPLYTVTFSETGLSGQPWSVELQGNTESTSSTSITFSDVSAGTYSYTVSDSEGYTAFPASGTITVSTSTLVQIAFTLPPTLYTVTFQALNYQSGETWYVTLNGQTTPASSGSISFSGLSTGSYPYTITPPSGYYASPPSGTVSVTQDTLVDITFNPLTVQYSITFYETGLPTGASWSVKLGTLTTSSQSDTVTFMEPNGLYSYSIINVTGFTVSPESGTVRVSNENPFATNIYFSQLPSFLTVTFDASGNAGSPWYVDFNGTINGTAGSQMTFIVKEGAYSYFAYSYGYGLANPSGQITVSDDTQIQLDFSEIGSSFTSVVDTFTSQTFLNDSMWDLMASNPAASRFYYEIGNVSQQNPGLVMNNFYAPMNNNPGVLSKDYLESRSSFTGPISVTISMEYFPVPGSVYPFVFDLTNGPAIRIDPAGELSVRNGGTFSNIIALTSFKYYNLTISISSNISYTVSTGDGVVALLDVPENLSNSQFQISYGTEYNPSSTGYSFEKALQVNSIYASSYQYFSLKVGFEREATPNGIWQWNKTIGLTAVNTATGELYKQQEVVSTLGGNVVVSRLPSATYLIYIMSQIVNESNVSSNISIGQSYTINVGFTGDSSIDSVTSDLNLPSKPVISAEIYSNNASMGMAPMADSFFSVVSGGHGNYAYSWMVTELGSRSSSVKGSTGDNLTYTFNGAGSYSVSMTVTDTIPYLGESMKLSASSNILEIYVGNPSYLLYLEPAGGSIASINYGSNDNSVLLYQENGNTYLSGNLSDTGSEVLNIPGFLSAIGLSNAWQGIKIGGTRFGSKTLPIAVQPGVTVTLNGIPVSVYDPIGNSNYDGTTLNFTFTPDTGVAIGWNLVSVVMDALGIISYIDSGILPEGLSVVQSMIKGILPTLIASVNLENGGGLLSFGSIAISLLGDVGKMVESMAANLPRIIGNELIANGYTIADVTGGILAKVGFSLGELFSVILSWIPIGVFVADLIQMASVYLQGPVNQSFDISSTSQYITQSISSHNPISVTATEKANAGTTAFVSSQDTQVYGYSGRWIGNSYLVHSSDVGGNLSFAFPDAGSISYTVQNPSTDSSANYSLSVSYGGHDTNVSGTLSPGSYVIYNLTNESGVIVLQKEVSLPSKAGFLIDMGSMAILILVISLSYYWYRRRSI